MNSLNYYDQIKNKLINNEIYSKVKDFSKERNRVITYYEVGKLLNEAGKKYGEDIIGKYSVKLMNEIGKTYNKKMLFKMRQLYVFFNNEKVAPLVRQLSWSHCLALLPIKDVNKINYYIDQIQKRNLSKRELQDIIKDKEYERLPEETKNKFDSKENIDNLIDYVKNPLVIRNSNNYDLLSEKVLKKLILEDIEYFMKELGDSFSFISSEYKIKIGNNYNYIDLLFFNIEFNCYVVVELKITELKKEHIGQIEVYMNYIDENLRKINQDKTIGIIICKQHNKYIIKYCSDDRIIARQYELM